MLKKRGAIYSVIALMLCAAVYLNWSYNQNNSEDGNDAQVGTHTVNGGLLGESLLVSGEIAESKLDYFADARLSRQKARDEAVSILNSTIENEKSDEQAVAAASAVIETMANNAMVESRIETLIIAKGYKECVAYVNDDTVNVIIAKKNDQLQDADVAKIKDIVIDEAGVTADKIKIIEAQD